MKKIVLLVFPLVVACSPSTKQEPILEKDYIGVSKGQIAAMLDSFNVAAANADFENYFGFYASDATFIGTDATEHWDKEHFMAWAKPYFDRKATWNFHSVSRNIYFGKHRDIAWFDELLNTQMKICRGSGVVVKDGERWKVQQYVLSMTVPNEAINKVLPLKAPMEDSLLKQLQQP
jgi:hypothetical protein